MPYNGSGGFTPAVSPNYPAVAGEVIYADRWNFVIGDIYTSLGQVICRDGQSSFLGNLNANGFKLTGLLAGASPGDSVNFSQLTALQVGGTLTNVVLTTSTASQPTAGSNDFSIPTTNWTQALVLAATNSAPSTSTTSLVTSSGTKNFTIQANRFWSAGQYALLSRTSTPTTVQMYGQIVSYNSATGAVVMSVPTDGVTGSGTFTDWTLAVTGPRQPAATAALIQATPLGVMNCTLGQNFYLAVSANTTFSFSNSVAAGLAYSAQLEVYHTGGTLSWDASIIWPGGVAPALTVNRRHLFFFTQSTDGTKKYASYLTNYPL